MVGWLVLRTSPLAACPLLPLLVCCAQHRLTACLSRNTLLCRREHQVQLARRAA